MPSFSCGSFSPLGSPSPGAWAAADMPARLLRGPGAPFPIAAEVDALRRSGAFNGLARILARSGSGSSMASSVESPSDVDVSTLVLPRQGMAITKISASDELLPAIRRAMAASAERQTDEDSAESDSDEDGSEESSESEDESEDDSEGYGEGGEEEEETDDELVDASPASSAYVVSDDAPQGMTLAQLVKKLRSRGELTDVADVDSAALFRDVSQRPAAFGA